MKKLLYILALAIGIFASITLYSPSQSLAAPNCSKPGLTAKEQIQCGACAAAGDTCPANAPKTAQNVVVEVINILSLLGGALAVIMIIVGGFRYIVSSGNQEQTKSAKNTIVYAVVGLVIIAVAQVIVQFVLNKTNNATNPPKSVIQQFYPSTDGNRWLP